MYWLKKKIALSGWKGLKGQAAWRKPPSWAGGVAQAALLSEGVAQAALPVRRGASRPCQGSNSHLQILPCLALRSFTG